MEPASLKTGSSANIAEGASTQTALLEVLERFVHLMALSGFDRELPQFSDSIRQLCKKAPRAASSLTNAILDECRVDTQREAIEQDQKQESATNNEKVVHSKGKATIDPTYRPPRTNPSGNGATTMQDTGGLSSIDAAPTTPTKQMDSASSSPQTEEIHRAKIPASLDGISSPLRSRTGSGSFSPEETPLIKMIIEAVHVIHQFSKYPHAAPREVHSRILQRL